MRSADLRVTLEGEGHPPVSAIVDRAPNAQSLLVLGHGAGAPMTHPFMEKLAGALATEGTSALRYNFAYAEAGRRRPDPPRKLHAVVASALRLGRQMAEGAALFAGGKSMGGRMTSSLVAERGRAGVLIGVAAHPGEAAVGPGATAPAPGERSADPGGTAAAPGESPTSGLAGLVFFGFPLHPARRSDTARAEHLAHAELPMLFHQGTRDRLADIGLMRTVVAQLGPRATLKEVDGAGHSFDVPKRSGRTVDEVIAQLAERTAAWIGRTP